MALDLIPKGERIIVKRSEKKAGLIIIPETNESMTATEGQVVAIGPGVEVYDIAIGDNVYFGRYSGSDIERDDEKYIIMNAEDVLAEVIEVK